MAVAQRELLSKQVLGRAGELTLPSFLFFETVDRTADFRNGDSQNGSKPEGETIWEGNPQMKLFSESEFIRGTQTYRDWHPTFHYPPQRDLLLNIIK